MGISTGLAASLVAGESHAAGETKQQKTEAAHVEDAPAEEETTDQLLDFPEAEHGSTFWAPGEEPAAQEAAADPVTEKKAELVQRETSARKGFADLHARKLEGGGYVQLAETSNTIKAHGTEGKADHSYSGSHNHAAWTSDHLAVSSASGRILEIKGGSSGVTFDSDYKAEMRLYKLPETKKLTDTGKDIKVMGIGKTQEDAVTHALAEAAELSNASAHAEVFRDGSFAPVTGAKKGAVEESRFVTIGASESVAYFDGFKVLTVVAPTEKGGDFTVTISAREAHAE